MDAGPGKVQINGNGKADIGSEGTDTFDENVTYDEKDFISGPKMSQNGSIPFNILEFEYPLFLDVSFLNQVYFPNT